MQRIVLTLFACLAIVAAGCSSSSTTAGGLPPGMSPVIPPRPGPETKSDTTNKGAPTIVGAWTLAEPKELPKEKGGGKLMITFEFTADGKVKVSESLNEKERVVLEGSYKHEANQVNISARKGGEEMPITFIILKLTDTELTINDPKKGEVEIKLVRKK